MLTELEIGRVPLSNDLIDRVPGVIDVTAAGLRARFEPSSEREMLIVRRDRHKETGHELPLGQKILGARRLAADTRPGRRQRRAVAGTCRGTLRK